MTTSSATLAPTPTATGPRFHWFLPTSGDGHQVGGVTAVQRRSTAATRRAPTLDYLAQVANAVELAGFDGALTPTGAGCEDSLVTCAGLAPLTSTLRLPGRVPAITDAAHGAGAAGGDVPTDQRRTPRPQRRHRR